MARRIAIIVVALVSIVVGALQWELVRTLLEHDGSFILATGPLNIAKTATGMSVAAEDLAFVAFGRGTLLLLIVWYGVLAVMALAGVWLLLTRRAERRSADT
jgi:hypothetical protein